ncbi:MAG TPA: asparagine synthase (glutamine-hydrolyzing) [Bryobacteraceae bacterium]|nr:asparagine synthase (glutamine-hydrolyzing) [Bryobacteraceae bacterium]
MCGIAGGWSRNPEVHRALGAALDKMIHRGPDDSGEYHQGPLFVGMRRLAIIDLPGGRQPIANEDGSVVVVYNGEIYNYQSLTSALRSRGHQFSTRSDTEVLVHLFEEQGVDLCKALRGMFAFAIVDTRSRRLFLARDRFGKKPLYYSRTNSGDLVFASELKALRCLLDAASAGLEINDQAIYDYLSLGYIPQPETVFRNVFALPPANWLLFDGEKLTVQPYWNLEMCPDDSLSFQEACERLRQLLSEAVRLRLRSDVPLGLFLSGGMDSSAIAWEASRCIGDKLRTFTVSMGASHDESPVAERTARELGVQNTRLELAVAPLTELEYLIRHYDQPYADSSAIPTLALSRMARQYVTVILNGDGGDELLGGYRRSFAARALDRLLWIPRTPWKALRKLPHDRRSAYGLAFRFARGLSLPQASRYLVWTSDLMLESDKSAAWLKSPVRPTEEWLDSILPSGRVALETQLLADIGINLPSDLLVKMDMATMAASLEARSPFLDHVLAEFLATVPHRYRFKRLKTKFLLRMAYKDRLAPEVINSPKRGFEIPLQAWLDGPLRSVVLDTVGCSRARVRDYVAPEFVDAVLQQGALTERNKAFLCYTFLVLEMWLEQFHSDKNATAVETVSAGLSL